MKINIRRSIFYLVLLTCVPLFTAYAQTSDDSGYKLKFAMINSKPYYYFEDNEYKGEAVYYLDRICKGAGYDYELYMYPVKRLLKFLENGEIDIAFLPEGLLNKNKVLLANQNTSTLNIGLYYNPSNLHEDDFVSLNGKRVIVVKNYTYSGFLHKLQSLYPDMKLVVANDPQATFKMLEYGRGDLVLAYQKITEHSQMPLENLSFKKLYRAKIFLTFSPNGKHPRLKQMVKDLNESNDLVISKK